MLTTTLLVFYVLAVIALYFIPLWIAIHRQSKQVVMIGWLNLLLGWTIIWWFGLLFVAAFGSVASPEERVKSVEVSATPTILTEAEAEEEEAYLQKLRITAGVIAGLVALGLVVLILFF